MVVPVGVDGDARHPRPGRRALLVDPQARRQVRRRSPAHELHVVQDPGRQGRARLPRPVRRALRAQPREHDRGGRGRHARRSSSSGSSDRRRDIKAADAAAARAAQAGRRRPDPRSDPTETPWQQPTPTKPGPRRSRPVPQIAAHGVERPPQRAGPRWLTTTDHKKIGIMYLVTTFVFFMMGGVEALMMRLQLGAGGQHAADAADLQRAVHDARHDDDLPVRRADHGRASATTSCR